MDCNTSIGPAGVLYHWPVCFRLILTPYRGFRNRQSIGATTLKLGTRTLIYMYFYHIKNVPGAQYISWNTCMGHVGAI